MSINLVNVNILYNINMVKHNNIFFQWLELEQNDENSQIELNKQYESSIISEKQSETMINQKEDQNYVQMIEQSLQNQQKCQDES